MASASQGMRRPRVRPSRGAGDPKHGLEGRRIIFSSACPKRLRLASADVTNAHFSRKDVDCAFLLASEPAPAESDAGVLRGAATVERRL